ncbi:hypothetical protein [Streptomyces mirabilis]|uniref:hypothetical protein n=1 Tax=Streptomyces mirabilis TaxID=68239 RepID=UPI0036CDD2E6
MKDLDLVDLPAADSCCGFGGISAAMLADKVRGVLDSGAEVPPPSTGPTSRPPAPASSQARPVLGRARGGRTSNVHLAVDGWSLPLSIVLTPGRATTPPHSVRSSAGSASPTVQGVGLARLPSVEGRRDPRPSESHAEE